MENPFTSRVARLDTLAKRMHAERLDWIEQLAGHRSFDPEAMHMQLGRLRRERDDVQSKLLLATDRCARLDPEQARLEALASAGLNPRWWFSSERTIAKRHLAVVSQQANQARSERTSLERSAAASDQLVKALGQRIRDYHAFDPLRAVATIEGIQVELEVNRAKARALGERRDALDRRLGDLPARLAALHLEQAAILRDIATAKRYDAALSNADTGQARAILHEECEACLGDSSPGRYISKQRGALAPLERDIDKLSRRIEHIISVATVDIDHLVIDGNNLCYAQNDFVGLAPLQALVPELLERYQVTLVFDASIRTLLKTRDAAIRATFPGGATVHVVASRGKADEVVLEQASGNPGAYVISNDRFADYPDKDAVSERRVLRHEIVGGTLSIMELGVRTRYGHGDGAAHVR